MHTLSRQKQQGAARFGVKAYTDVRKMVDEISPDVCDVVVPMQLHHVVSCYLSRCGIPHNVETGLAPTLGLMDMMIADAAKNGVKLQTSENFPFVPVEQFVMQTHHGRRNWERPQVLQRLFSTTGYHGLAAIRCRMDAAPKMVSSIGHSMPVMSYVDRAKRDHNREGLEFYAIDFENGGLGIAMVGNKNGCLGRNKLVGFETCGERGTIITNGNQGAPVVKQSIVCTERRIAKLEDRAQTYEFGQREYSDDGTLPCVSLWSSMPESLGGTVAWVNPYRQTDISETGISLAVDDA